MNVEIDKNTTIYVDSNIFMNEKADYFFETLENGHMLIVPKEQYNELYNLKNSENSEKAYKARNAFKIIEQLLDNNILQIENLNDNTKKESYADPIFIKSILTKLENNNNVILITEDTDLRIRLKNAIKENQDYDALVKIYTLSDIQRREYTPYRKPSTFDKVKNVAKDVFSIALIGVAIIGAFME